MVHGHRESPVLFTSDGLWEHAVWPSYTVSSARRVPMSERTQAYREKLRNGEYDLGWMQVNSEWGVRATPSKRGLTLDDINVGSYGVIPADASESLSFAP